MIARISCIFVGRRKQNELLKQWKFFIHTHDERIDMRTKPNLASMGKHRAEFAGQCAQPPQRFSPLRDIDIGRRNGD